MKEGSQSISIVLHGSLATEVFVTPKDSVGEMAKIGVLYCRTPWRKERHFGRKKKNVRRP